MANKDLKFNGRQDAYVDVRFGDDDIDETGMHQRTVVVETNHGTYALCFMDLPADPRGTENPRRYGDVDICLYDDAGETVDITAGGWANGDPALLTGPDTIAKDERTKGAKVKLIALISGIIKKEVAA